MKQIESYEVYTDQTFKNAHLDQVTLESVEFYDCLFSNCSFLETVFQRCRFSNCIFRDCDLGLMQVPDSRFVMTSFEKSRLIGVNWTLADWPATGFSQALAFNSCVLNHGTFIGLKMKEGTFLDCILVEVDFREADLTKANFSGSDLDRSLFSDTILKKADLSRARNYDIAPGRNELAGAKFSLPEAMSLLYNLDIKLVEPGE